MNICAISLQAVNVDLVYPLCLAHLLDSQLKEKLLVFPSFLSYMRGRPYAFLCKVLHFALGFLHNEYIASSNVGLPQLLSKI